MFKSTDGNTSWRYVVQEYQLNCVAMDPANSSTLVVGSRDGKVYHSTDGGDNWTNIHVMAVDPNEPDTAYAGVWGAALSRPPMTLYASAYPGGTFKSTDGGSTWGCTVSACTNRPMALVSGDR